MAKSKGGVADWLRAANPLKRAETEAEARRAARIGSVALVLSAFQSFVFLANLGGFSSGMSAYMAKMYLQAGMDQATATAMTGQVSSFIRPLMIGSTVIWIAVLAILAVVQWRKPNWIIPAIWLAFCLYGLLSGIMSPLQQARLGMHLLSPAWLAFSLIGLLVQMVLFAAGFRGARRLAAVREDAAITAAIA